ncbi:MAG: peptide-methionine (S)-S-oxide reductase MsrA [Hyphomonadaceae bacterium]
MRWLAGLCLSLFLAACSPSAAQTPAQSARETAIFAGGCFWCVESDFEHLDGVIEAESGYTGGDLQNPTYRNHEGHVEAVRVTYDPRRVSYAQLLHHFWRHHDPLDAGGQFCDRGPSYRSAIFVTPGQRAEAEASLAEAERVLGRSVATPIRPASRFWRAETYHQDYYEKNPIQYRYYRFRCGRDERVHEVWGDR